MTNTSDVLTVTDLKKSPKRVFTESKSRKEAIVIYNNIAESIVMDISTFNNLETKIELLNEKIFELEIAMRLRTNTETWSDEEARGEREFKDLSKIKDEWL
ncbi:MAG TPA: hypothetical protein DIW15_04445 [Bavariicoccus seileri]|uniref:Antitoxin n=1 Tax=Bavariicoccus seileri TaxID=549685 RepID=A0A3D4S7K5_9ENTE|nr:hypothetical protein [Bavariicoccus seileri]HCS93941.1 hypothetical protein [Bavariicoccus seileri]